MENNFVTVHSKPNWLPSTMQSSFGLKGKFKIISRDHKTGKVVGVIECENLIMFDTNLGVNIFLQQLVGITTYPMAVTSAEIGTGTGTITASDNALFVGTTVTGIALASYILSTTNVQLSFFIPDGSLPNGTYTNFLLRMGTQALAHALITPNYVKTSGIDTTVEYTLTGSN